MTLSEIFTTAFANETNQVSFSQAAVIMAASVICCAIICVIYRVVYRGVLFSRSFCASVFAMGVITSLLILAIRTSIYLTLGGLGALSVVRFRTAIKEPMDVTFMFFAICEGIICGANMLTIAFAGVILLGALLVLYSFLPSNTGNHILMITSDSPRDDEIGSCLSSSVKSYKLKSRSVSSSGVEYAYEVKLKDGNALFTDTIKSIDGVSGVAVAKSSVEYM